MNYENALDLQWEVLFDYHYCFPPGAKIRSTLVSYFTHMGLIISWSLEVNNMNNQETFH
jgi:hypothetical protein